MERKRVLRRVVKASKIDCLLYAEHIERAGTGFFWAVCENDCEGIVAKHRLGPYEATPVTWFKVLNPDYSQKRGRKEMFDKFHERRETRFGANAHQ